MQKAVVISLCFDDGQRAREVPVCITVDPPDTENRQIKFSAVDAINPPFSALTLDLVELLEALEELGEPEVQGASAAYVVQKMADRVIDLSNRVKDLESRLDRLFDDVHHGGDE